MYVRALINESLFTKNVLLFKFHRKEKFLQNQYLALVLTRPIDV